jgi:hypothetical protein
MHLFLKGGARRRNHESMSRVIQSHELHGRSLHSFSMVNLSMCSIPVFLSIYSFFLGGHPMVCYGYP